MYGIVRLFKFILKVAVGESIENAPLRYPYSAFTIESSTPTLRINFNEPMPVFFTIPVSFKTFEDAEYSR
jgi:hypothetical protein